MQIKHGQNRPVTLSTVSRRGFLKSATAVAAAAALPALAQHSGSKEERILAYVGCYTPNGQGIHLFDMNPASGKLTQIKVFQGMDVPLVSTMNPSWLALDPQKKYLYAGNEISNFEGTTSGAVSAFAVDRSKGDLTFLNSISSQGSTLPSNFVGTNFTSEVIISHDGRFIYAANRLHNTIAIFDI
ncbi:MAG: beta-propeller fold lactonase family protein, partial [Blastocatellia bacterium]|nr:beta-propeller fold lactonase family protein [Blastocatellia bacterium]